MSGLFKNLNNRGRSFFAFLLGSVLVLALPPYFILPIIFLGFSGFFVLLQKAECPKQAFWNGWAFGFGYFLFGFYWVSNSMLVDAEKFAWLIPFAVCLIPAISAIFTGAACFCAYHLKRDSHLRNILIFAGLWTFMEILRGDITQFPWNFVGYMWLSPFTDFNIAQYASFFGVFGLSFLLVITGCLPILMYHRCWKSFGLIVITLTLMAIFSDQPKEILTSTNATIRIVQPNITQKEKHNPNKQFDILIKQLKMTSTMPEGENPNIVIWPEASINYLIEDDAKLREMMADAMPPNSLIAVGAMRIKPTDNKNKVFNSLFVVNKQAKIEAFYDKSTLVPFGEFVPMQRYLPFINKITQGSEGFSTGDGVQTISLEGHPSFSPLICYEIAFPTHVIDKNHRPDYIMNITNDSWFGNSSGPYQHLNIARMRAIEERIPVLRVASTGISAVIDASGNVISSIPLNEEKVLDVKLPRYSKEIIGMYSNYGNIIIILLIISVLTVTAFPARTNHW